MSTKDRSKCKTLLGTLSDYVDGELSEELCRDLESHLEECEDCRIVVDTLRKTVSLYRQSAAELAQVPGPVRERLLRTLNLDDYIKR